MTQSGVVRLFNFKIMGNLSLEHFLHKNRDVLSLECFDPVTPSTDWDMDWTEDIDDWPCHTIKINCHG